MEKGGIWKELAESEMVLVGLGEEWNETRYLGRDQIYVCGRQWLEAEGHSWLVPAWMEYCLEDPVKDGLKEARDKLIRCLEGKNYFVVSVSTHTAVARGAWREGRFVAPCGTAWKKQCRNTCNKGPVPVTEEDWQSLRRLFDGLSQGTMFQAEENGLGCCADCGTPYVLNTVYATDYDERGYQDSWQQYTKWLQGTMNRRLLVLELGVGMQFPSVIRWPFEKIAFYNQKAGFYRVNGHLYQLTKELAGKGCGISQNAIDWLRCM